MKPFGPDRELVPGVRVLAHLHRSRVFDVYDTRCERRGCRVVAKVLRPDRLADRRARAALLREGRRLKRLTHPHLVRAYQVHGGPRPLVVLETLPGETLAHLVARRPLSGPELAELTRQLASPLGYLHAEGLLHLDLKPDNVVVEAGRARLLDLSVARAPGPAPAETGTWCQRAPEQERGGVLGPAADVWGLGTVLHEAATGVNPFLAHADLEHPVLEVRPPSLRDRRSGLPAELAALVDACLAPAPEDRPALAALAEARS